MGIAVGLVVHNRLLFRATKSLFEKENECHRLVEQLEKTSKSVAGRTQFLPDYV